MSATRVGRRSAGREAFFGTTRFDDFASRAGISAPVAATRLRELVDEGLQAGLKGSHQEDEAEAGDPGPCHF
jgi:hypothetical protein